MRGRLLVGVTIQEGEEAVLAVCIGFVQDAEFLVFGAL
jgi:hypothetical protein